MNLMCRTLWLGAIGICLLIAGCKTEKPPPKGELEPARILPLPTTPPTVIYVCDFDYESQQKGLDVSSQTVDFTQSGVDVHSPAKPELQALTESLIQELSRAGFQARRLSPQAPAPKHGWLVRGHVMKSAPNKALSRVVVQLWDLEQGIPTPLYQFKTSFEKSNSTEALILAPYSFVMRNRNLDENLNQTATEIAANITHRISDVKGH